MAERGRKRARPPGDSVLRLVSPKAKALDPGLDPQELVRRILCPIPLDTFLSECWAEKVVAVQGPARRVAPLCRACGGLQLEEMLELTPSEQVHAWLKGEQGTVRSVSVDAAAAMGLAEAKAALYFRAPEALEDLLVPGLCQGLGAAFAGMYPGDGRPRGEIETFVSQGGHVTGWHTDFQHNFTFQLRGAKRWRFKPGPVRNNVRALTPHFQTRSNFEQQMKLHAISDPSMPDFKPPDEFFQDAEVVEIHAGDVLYHPAGVWHQVESAGEGESISINVSLSCATWAEMVGDAVRQALWRSEPLRSPLVGLAGRELADVRREVEVQLREAKKRINALTAEDLLAPVMLDRPPEHIHLGRSSLGKSFKVSQSSRFRFSRLAALVELPEDASEVDMGLGKQRLLLQELRTLKGHIYR
ncbi:unnamed protein product [Effrenium voratum]|uniref:JmjC domain-containing protein n=1 Tax=Effrenium voratum TaxID=2562239 RepID=A0AA36IZA5_9DINO|nr:unnamed protein product [Effrenium voratum]